VRSTWSAGERSEGEAPKAGADPFPRGARKVPAADGKRFAVAPALPRRYGLEWDDLCAWEDCPALIFGSFDLDRNLLGKIFGLSSGVGDHCSDRLADIGDALIGEDRLRNRDSSALA
jgi:hypothetical protein